MPLPFNKFNIKEQNSVKNMIKFLSLEACLKTRVLMNFWNLQKYSHKKISNYNLRYLTLPGLIGWAQVNYLYRASIEGSRNKLSFDIVYLENQ